MQTLPFLSPLQPSSDGALPLIGANPESESTGFDVIFQELEAPATKVDDVAPELPETPEMQDVETAETEADLRPEAEDKSFDLQVGPATSELETAQRPVVDGLEKRVPADADLEIVSPKGTSFPNNESDRPDYVPREKSALRVPEIPETATRTSTPHTDPDTSARSTALVENPAGHLVGLRQADRPTAPQIGAGATQHSQTPVEVARDFPGGSKAVSVHERPTRTTPKNPLPDVARNSPSQAFGKTEGSEYMPQSRVHLSQSRDITPFPSGLGSARMASDKGAIGFSAAARQPTEPMQHVSIAETPKNSMPQVSIKHPVAAHESGLPARALPHQDKKSVVKPDPAPASLGKTRPAEATTPQTATRVDAGAPLPAIRMATSPTGPQMPQDRQMTVRATAQPVQPQGAKHITEQEISGNRQIPLQTGLAKTVTAAHVMAPATPVEPATGIQSGGRNLLSGTAQRPVRTDAPSAEPPQQTKIEPRIDSVSPQNPRTERQIPAQVDQVSAVPPSPKSDVMVKDNVTPKDRDSIQPFSSPKETPIAPQRFPLTGATPPFSSSRQYVQPTLETRPSTGTDSVPTGTPQAVSRSIIGTKKTLPEQPILPQRFPVAGAAPPYSSSRQFIQSTLEARPSTGTDAVPADAPQIGSGSNTRSEKTLPVFAPAPPPRAPTPPLENWHKTRA